MTEFLSEENLTLHNEYLRALLLRYSILQKSISGIIGKNVSEIFRMRLPYAERKDVFALLPEIELHELYFASFCASKNLRSAILCERFGSEAAFLNLLYRLGMQLEYGFIAVNMSGGRIECITAKDYVDAYRFGVPMLAIDVCEHAYFYDYGFDKSAYLISALPYLDLSKIDNFFS